MNQYTVLAEYYDRLTDDVPYEALCERIGYLLDKGRLNTRFVLELGCGTGTLSRLLSLKGYELISVDSSPEMLGIAREKCAGLKEPPVFVCQDMCQLDLYGTVQAAVCTLDSLNYLPSMEAVRKTFAKVNLFLESQGLFIFDVKAPQMFEEMAGEVSVFETEDTFCVWQYGYDKSDCSAQHVIDIFYRDGAKYSRLTEYHDQMAFSRLKLEDALAKARFRVKGIYQGTSAREAEGDQGRLLFVAEKL